MVLAAHHHRLFDMRRVHEAGRARRGPGRERTERYDRTSAPNDGSNSVEAAPNGMDVRGDDARARS